MLHRLLRTQTPVILLCRSRHTEQETVSARTRIERRLQELGSAEHADRVEVIDADLADRAAQPLTDAQHRSLRRLDSRRLLLVNVAASLKMENPGQSAEHRRAISR